MSNIVFVKTGREIKAAVQKRRTQLEARLQVRNQALDEFLKDIKKVRSYLVRSVEPNYGHGGRGYSLYSQDDISSEERQEVDQMCRRIFEIEQELHRLSLINSHLRDEDVFHLNFDDLIGYGFDTSLEGGPR
jgi:hypothetical protein